MNQSGSQSLGGVIDPGKIVDLSRITNLNGVTVCRDKILFQELKSSLKIITNQ